MQPYNNIIGQLLAIKNLELNMKKTTETSSV